MVWITRVGKVRTNCSWTNSSELFFGVYTILFLSYHSPNVATEQSEHALRAYLGKHVTPSAYRPRSRSFKLPETAVQFFPVVSGTPRTNFSKLFNELNSRMFTVHSIVCLLLDPQKSLWNILMQQIKFPQWNPDFTIVDILDQHSVPQKELQPKLYGVDCRFNWRFDGRHL